MCRPLNSGEGVEAPFVCAPVLRSQESLPCDSILRANAAASTASHPAFVTTAKRPSCRERTGRAGRTDLPDGESEMFFAKGLDDPNQIEIIAINRSGRNSLIARSGRIAAKKQPVLGTLARQGGDVGHGAFISNPHPYGGWKFRNDGYRRISASPKTTTGVTEEERGRRPAVGEPERVPTGPCAQHVPWFLCYVLNRQRSIGPSVSPH